MKVYWKIEWLPFRLFIAFFVNIISCFFRVFFPSCTYHIVPRAVVSLPLIKNERNMIYGRARNVISYWKYPCVPNEFNLKRIIHFYILFMLFISFHIHSANFPSFCSRSKWTQQKKWRKIKIDYKIMNCKKMRFPE